jgi:hypothetical protein
MADNFASYQAGLTSPAANGVAIVPDDANDLPTSTRGIYVGTTGDVVAILVGDTLATTYTAVPGGSVLPIRAKRVKATGTTATNLVGLS